jgi:hypothetical protein
LAPSRSWALPPGLVLFQLLWPTKARHGKQLLALFLAAIPICQKSHSPLTRDDSIRKNLMHVQACTPFVENLHLVSPCDVLLIEHVLVFRNAEALGMDEQRFTSCVLLATRSFSQAQQWVVPAHTRISLVDWLVCTICPRSLCWRILLHSTLFHPGWCSPT